MPPKPPPTEKNPHEDLQAFERLPPAQKEIALLKDEAEKSTGPANATLHRTIRQKAGTDRSPPAG